MNRNSTSRTKKKSIFNSRAIVLSISLLLVANIVGVQAQTSSRPDRGFGGQGGFQTTGIDAISLQNGSLNVNVPLASLPPMAGGKLGYTLQATYNSKLWDVKRSEVHRAGPVCGDKYVTQEVLLGDGGGWRIGGRHEIFFRRASDDFAYVQPFSDQCDGYIDNYNMNLGGVYFKPMLRTPDGAERELRIEGSFPMFENSMTSRQYMLGYYKSPWQVSPWGPDFSGPIRFYTIDGSNLTAVYDDASTTTRWTARSSR